MNFKFKMQEMQCICAVNWSILLYNEVFTYRWSVATAMHQRYVNTGT